MLGRAHERLVYGRRITVLGRHLREVLPRGASVLDVGAGDGRLAHEVQRHRPDLRLEGVDVLVRPDTVIPVRPFDGERLPYADNAFDVVMMVDVLHHASAQDVLLEETARVARRAVVIKDHAVAGALAGPTLAFMDWIGNRRHGVALPYSYWTPHRWRQSFARLHLREIEHRDHLGLYPWPASLIFERRLHFLSVLEHDR